MQLHIRDDAAKIRAALGGMFVPPYPACRGAFDPARAADDYASVTRWWRPSKRRSDSAKMIKATGIGYCLPGLLEEGDTAYFDPYAPATDKDIVLLQLDSDWLSRLLKAVEASETSYRAKWIKSYAGSDGGVGNLACKLLRHGKDGHIWMTYAKAAHRMQRGEIVLGVCRMIEKGRHAA